VGEWPIGTSVAILRVSATLVALAGACVLCCHWWVSRSPGSAWLGAAVLALAISQLPSALLELNSATATAIQTRDTVLDSILALPFVVLLMLGTGERTFQRRISPVLVGVSVGIALATLRIVYITFDLEALLRVPESSLLMRLAASGMLGGFTVAILLQMHSLPRWVRNETIIAALAVTYGRLGRQEGVGDSNFWDIAAGATMLAGFLLFASTATELLRDALGDNERRLARTLERAESAERSHRNDEERLHELRGAVAGIGSASRILTGLNAELAPAQQRKLADLVSLEMDRLERLLTGGRAEPEVVELDPLIQSLVSAYRYLGVPIHSFSSGARAWAVASDLTDALHVLLSNAARHAPGSTTMVWVRSRQDRVELHVSDDGPGIPPTIRSHVFDRGVRHDGSSGQGLGLYIARRTLAEHGGSLDLADDPHHATSFVVRLPLREPA
jgi:signal transduction histidine kinase